MQKGVQILAQTKIGSYLAQGVSDKPERHYTDAEFDGGSNGDIESR